MNLGPGAAVECKTPGVTRGGGEGCWCLELTNAELINVLALRVGKKRLKGESSIPSRFHFSNFSSSLGSLVCEFLSAVIEGCIS